MILALQTADFTTHLWLYPNATDASPSASLEWESGRALSDQLLDKLEGFLKSHKGTWQDLEGIVIFSGPGSFTSLRISHATANALADSLGIPVVGAAGDNWQAHGVSRLAETKAGVPAVPAYGSEAHITKPKS